MNDRPDEFTRGWGEWLDKWDREIYQTIFAPRGISRDAALTFWTGNSLNEKLDKWRRMVEKHLVDRGDQWRDK